MKTTFPIVLGAVGLASVMATPAFAIDGLSANAAVTTDYVFRGISQSGADPAVQAGLDYNIGKTGLSVGTWASSINFGDNTPMEWDLYGGYSHSFGDKFALSVGAIHYTYPSSPHNVNYNWYEGWGGASYNFGFLSISAKVFYSPDYVNLSDSQWYFTGGVSAPVTPWLTLNANVGHTALDHAVPFIIKDYTDWNVSAAFSYEAYTLTVGYTDTDLSGGYKIKSGPFQTNAQFYVMFGFKLG